MQLPCSAAGPSRLACSALACATLLLACDPSDDPGDPMPIEDLAELEGVWAQRGYARMLEITDGRVVEYHVTNVSCVRADELEIAEVEATHDRIMGTDQTLSWYERGHFTHADFDRVDALPPGCEDVGVVADPEANFEALWHLFAENYAYFDVRGVDWDATYEAHRSQVGPETTAEELLSVLSQVLTPLDDGHVYVFDGVSQGFLSGSLGE